MVAESESTCIKIGAEMNIYDISKISGFSITTVSRVLNGSEKVSEKTRQKVLDAMEEVGYTPNAFARGLGLDTMRTVGILSVDAADPNACTNFAKSISYLQRELRRHDFDSILHCVGYDMKGKAESVKMMLERRVDAIVVVGSFFIEQNPKDNQCFRDAAKTTPIWLLNGSLENENISTIMCDDYNSGFKATTELLEAGIKNPLFLSCNMSESEKRQIEGYKTALKLKDIPLREEYICQCPRDMAEGRDYLINLAKEGLKFDGVVACEDTVAISVLKYAHASGISIPEDLCVIGKGNSMLSKCCHPELSTMDINIEAMCISAISMLIRNLEGVKMPTQTIISSSFVQRETTKKR